MKTLTVRIYDSASQEIAWVRMSSRRQLECVMPETGGPAINVLDLMPSCPMDITTLGCLAAGAAQDAGLDYRREWQGRWELEPSTPDDREMPCLLICERLPAMAIPNREITELESIELESLVDTAKLRELSHEETVRYFQLLGYNQEWAEHLARYGFPTE